MHRRHPVSTSLAAVLVLAACTDRPSADASPPPASEPPPQTVAYACEDGRAAEASYGAAGSLTLTVGDETWPMNPAEAVSGARWTGEAFEWWVTLEGGQEIGTLRRLGPDRIGETVVARCVRPSAGGVLAPEPPTGDVGGPEPAALPESPCRAPALSLAVVSTEGAAGSRHTVLAFENQGSSLCRLQGYPGLTLIGADGRPRDDIRVDQNPGAYYPAGEAIGPVELEPGGRAFFDLVSTAVAGEIPGETEPCRATVAVRASPPGDAGSVQAPLELNPCNGRVRVTAFRPVEDPARGG